MLACWLTENGGCFWPPNKAAQINRAIHKEQEPQHDWEVHPVRKLATAGKVHEKSAKETMVTCVRLCENGHSTTWHSQLQLHRMPIGNIKLASSIFATGASPTKVMRTMRAMECPMLFLATYYNMQKHYIVNAVGSVFTSKQDVML